MIPRKRSMIGKIMGSGVKSECARIDWSKGRARSMTGTMTAHEASEIKKSKKIKQ
jgi:hypothetical protein